MMLLKSEDRILLPFNYAWQKGKGNHFFFSFLHVVSRQWPRHVWPSQVGPENFPLIKEADTDVPQESGQLLKLLPKKLAMMSELLSKATGRP